MIVTPSFRPTPLAEHDYKRRRSLLTLRRTAFLIAAGLFATILGTTAWPQPPDQNAIVVKITGLRNDKGQVLCALFSSAADFPKNTANAIAVTKSQISDRHAVCEFAGVAPGTYAASVIHDENSNGKLDTNFMGIPKEGVGASNNARGRLGPPKFSSAAFSFASGKLELNITVIYL
jgi:uncharacterized protein (DUF2141 family)